MATISLDTRQWTGPQPHDSAEAAASYAESYNEGSATTIEHRNAAHSMASRGVAEHALKVAIHPATDPESLADRQARAELRPNPGKGILPR